MQKFIPYEKLSKKKKRELDARGRASWGSLSPVTRKPRCNRAYNRKRTQDWKRELPPDLCSFLYFPCLHCGHSKICPPPPKYKESRRSAHSGAIL